jgi:hypothetical protein
MKKLSIAVVLALSITTAHADFVPVAWGQEMPVECQNPLFNGLQYKYSGSCVVPWLGNFVRFWHWFDTRPEQQ